MGKIHFDYVGALENLSEDGRSREHLKKLRVQHGLTQQDVADELESGLRSINQIHIARLSQLYGVTKAYILWGANCIDSDNGQPVDVPVEDIPDEKRIQLAYHERLDKLSFQLNEDGVKKLIERAKELLEIPRYRRIKEE